MSWRTDPSRVCVLEAVVKKQPQLSEELTLLPNLNYFFLPSYVFMIFIIGAGI